jgi:hypothetical protein
MVRLMGDLLAFDFLRDEHILRLFSNAQLRKGKAFTVKELHTLARPGPYTERFYEQLATLADKGVFFRGYTLTCPTCDLSTWYALPDLAERVICQGCRTTFQMPLEIPFAYRPNRLFCEGLKNGALTVLLTALYLCDGCDSWVWEVGLFVHKNGLSADIDLIVQCPDRITIVECKDNLKASDLSHVHQQLTVLRQIAADIHAECAFSTLADMPDNFLPPPSLRVITRRDLLRL